MADVNGITLSTCSFSNIDDDIDLVRRVQNGDQDSFGLIIEKYQSFVFGVIRSIVYDPGIEDDLAQESFLAAYKGIKGFRGDARLKSWLYKITLNVCLNYLRHKKTGYNTEYSDDLENQVDSRLTPDKCQERKELRQCILEVMKKLPLKYRSMIHLHYNEDMQYDEIAKVTGLPIGTVKSHLHRAKDQLRKALSNQGWLKESEF
jgi:RNA polymerase sigma-70 factor, ECF subfamily